jgi:hypothetical protein
MMRRWLGFLVVTVLAAAAHAQSTAPLQNFCSVGNVKAVTQGSSSTNTLQGSYPRCTVTVYLTGTATKATIYADNISTPLGNPFTAGTNGSFLFYAATGQGYDITLSGGSPIAMPAPFTLVDAYVGNGVGTAVTAVTVATANGFQGTSSGGTAPALSINTDSTHVLPVNTGPNTAFLSQAGTYGVPGLGVYDPLGSAAAAQAAAIAASLQKVNNLSDVANAATSRTNLGLGTMAVQNATSVAITGGAIDGTVIGVTTPAAVNGTAGNFKGGNLVELPAATATSSTNYNPFNIVTQGSYWNGTAAQTDAWFLQDQLGTGTNPTSTLAIQHSGSSGTATVNFGGVGIATSTTTTASVNGVYYAKNGDNLQTIINTADAAGGGSIVIANGTYTGPFTLPDDGNCVNLLGAEMAATILTTATATTPVIFKGRASKPYGCKISDLTINGNLQAATGIQLQQGKAWNISNIIYLRIATGGEGLALGNTIDGEAMYETTTNNQHFNFNQIPDYPTYASIPLNCIHVYSSANDNYFFQLVGENCSNAGVQDDAGDNHYAMLHFYGNPQSYSPNYMMVVGSDFYISHLSSDTAAIAGVRVTGNGGGVITDSSFFGCLDGVTNCGAYAVVADAGKGQNLVVANNVIGGITSYIGEYIVVSFNGGALPFASDVIMNNTGFAYGGMEYAFPNYMNSGSLSKGGATPVGQFSAAPAFSGTPSFYSRMTTGQTSSASHFACAGPDAVLDCRLDWRGALINPSVTSGSIVVNGLATPSAPTVTVVGTAGSTTYTYVCSALAGTTGETLALNTTSISTGNATLSATNYNNITCPSQTYISGVNIYRTAGGSTQGLIIANAAHGIAYPDTGLTATTAVPLTNTTGNAKFISSQFDTTVTNAQPACNATNRGKQWVLKGNGTTTSDVYQSCLLQATGAYLWATVPNTGAYSLTHNDAWTVQPSLFATSTAASGVFYEANAATLSAVTARLEGGITCTTAPMVAILDLGTSPGTAYGSATVLTSLATGTADGAFAANGLNVGITAGHYVGIGFSAGTCATAPTISITATVQ